MKQLLSSHTSIYQTDNEEQTVTMDANGCKGEQATGNLFSLFLYQMFGRFVQTKDDFSLKINYHLLQKEVSEILLFSKQDYFMVQ